MFQDSPLLQGCFLFLGIAKVFLGRKAFTCMNLESTFCIYNTVRGEKFTPFTWFPLKFVLTILTEKRQISAPTNQQIHLISTPMNQCIQLTLLFAQYIVSHHALKTPWGWTATRIWYKFRQTKCAQKNASKLASSCKCKACGFHANKKLPTTAAVSTKTA